MFDWVRSLPRRPIKPAGSKTGTVANTRYTTIVCKMHAALIDSQCIVSMDNYFHPTALSPLSFWTTTIHFIEVMDDVSPSCFSAFSRQFMVYKSIHWVWTHIAGLPHHFFSTSFSFILITYDKIFSKWWQCAACVNGEVCLWMHELMQHDGYHWSAFT